jgi:hypothetical protein
VPSGSAVAGGHRVLAAGRVLADDPLAFDDRAGQFTVSGVLRGDGDEVAGMKLERVPDRAVLKLQRDGDALFL